MEAITCLSSVSLLRGSAYSRTIRIIDNTHGIPTGTRSIRSSSQTSGITLRLLRCLRIRRRRTQSECPQRHGSCPQIHVVNLDDGLSVGRLGEARVVRRDLENLVWCRIQDSKQEIQKMLKRSVVIALILVSAAGSLVVAQEDGLLTPNTALDVMSGSIVDVTSDGRWLVVTVQSRRDRTDVDHMRFGDPTYVSPASTRVLLVETTSGDQEWLFADPVRIRGLTWSPDDTQLGYFLMEGGQYQLRLYDIESGNTRSISLGTAKEISSNSPLIWAPDGSSVLLSLRPEAWAEEAQQAFGVITSGPVVIQDSRNDFLAWDRVRNLANRQVAALVNVSSGAVEEIL